MLAGMNVTVVYDSKDPQSSSARYQMIQSYHADVSLAIKLALEDAGYQVTLLPANTDLPEKLMAFHPGFAFNCSSLPKGLAERAYAPWILKEMDIPFTGSGGQTCFNAYNKIKTKRILQNAGICTPQAIVLRKPFPSFLSPKLKFPLFVKPVRGGCSFGINRNSFVPDWQTLQERLPEFARQFDQALLLEEFLPGREFTVGVLGNRDLRVLPIMEFGYKQQDHPSFRSYALKMINYDQEEVCCPADLKAEKRGEIESMARRTFRALGCRDYARIDFRMNRAGKPFVLDVNALPNLMPDTSSYAIMARQGGLTFNALIKTILRAAQTRYDMSF